MRQYDTYVQQASLALAAGKAVIFPTDTVYGIGVAVGISPSPDILYDLKGRDHGKPVACLISSPELLRVYGEQVPEYAHVLAEKFWPGALTLVVTASEALDPNYRAQDGSVGLRMPNHTLVLDIIDAVGVPLATSSANISGQKAPKAYGDLDPHLIEKVAFTLSDDTGQSGLASSVIDCRGAAPLMIREGDISLEDIEAALM